MSPGGSSCEHAQASCDESYETDKDANGERFLSRQSHVGEK